MRRAAAAAFVLLAIAGGCRRKPEAVNLNAQNRVAVRPAHLYYESPRMLLARETRNIPLPGNVAGALAGVMRELVKGPSTPTLGRLLPADTVVRGVYLLPEGTAIIDLGGPTLTGGWPTGSHQELMAVFSVVQTAAENFREVQRVRILVNGTPAETLGGHIALDRPLRPLAAVVEGSSR